MNSVAAQQRSSAWHQTEQFSLLAYKAAGCMQFEAQQALVEGLWYYTHGCMCNGCPANNGKCSAQLTLRANHILGVAEPKKKLVYTETVREEAQRLGISISEVRRRRASAALGRS
jgi:hypothetical protein